jgi:hypothetical protein
MDSWGDQRIADLLTSLDKAESQHLDSLTLSDLLKGGDAIVNRVSATKAGAPSPADQS